MRAVGLDQLGPVHAVLIPSFPQQWRRIQHNKRMTSEDIAKANAFNVKHGIVHLPHEVNSAKSRLRSRVAASAHQRRAVKITLPHLKILDAGD
jgi:hypothetical protein